MSNKTQLQQYNNELSALISRVNAAKDTAASLPEAGGGGGALETITITLPNDRLDPGSMVYYLDPTMSLALIDIIEGDSFTTIKNSILVTTGMMGRSFPSCTYLVGNSMCAAYLVTGES